MKDIKQFYLTGLPVDTDLGQCHFIKVRDYPDYYIDLNVLTLTKIHIINGFKESKVDEKLIEALNTLTLFDLILIVEDFRKSYMRLFEKVFHKDIFDQLDENNFYYYRQLIMEMHCIKEEYINPNPEIQKFIEKSRRMKENGEKLDIGDIISSIVTFCGFTYEQVLDMTVYQMQTTFNRISLFKGYDTSTLFATVSTEKIDIPSWCKHIDLTEAEKLGYTRDEYSQLASGVFGG